ncbi:uncharacterized protein CIMG_03786 [Coccidioides immitis RS]|uniref:Mid2 domain-containing protein n=2 Tax=Coccidioides immitis TaxID=5501 RepID=A0A0E1S2Z1_COCIM|nr:uncharacterized protein CIMG_03786 [Coccidioides immitis RS]EAS32762.1 hypothetical protein CIMG_03786 [Coccidioides immitis RS]KMP08025.1 hypothetical protein CIRG_07706 [Coccidioides immitis RMSCC 2394]
MRWPSTLSILLLSLIVLAVAVSGAGVDRRQLSLGDAVQSPQSSATGDDLDDDTPTSSARSTSSPTSEPDPETSTSESTSERSTSSSPTAQPTPTPPSSTPESTPPSTPPITPRPTPTRDTPPPPSKSVVIVTYTVTSDDQTIIQTSQSTAPQPTNAPGIGDDPSGSDSSGLSDSSRNIIIGVVVGVGGAVLLSGLALVVYRLRRKRNARTEPDEDDLTGTALGSHSHAASMSSSPFKTTLDQYHNPGPVNPASNF